MSEPANVFALPRPMPESFWIEQYPGILTAKKLRTARRAGQVGYYPSGRGYAYTPEQIGDYLTKERVDPCQNSDSKSAGTGSDKSQEATRGIDTATSPYHDESAAEASAQRILK